MPYRKKLKYTRVEDLSHTNANSLFGRDSHPARENYIVYLTIHYFAYNQRESAIDILIIRAIYSSVKSISQ